jgi:hypothetical protein
LSRPQKSFYVVVRTQQETKVSLARTTLMMESLCLAFAVGKVIVDGGGAMGADD